MTEATDRSKIFLALIAVITFVASFDLVVLITNRSGDFTTLDYIEAASKALIILVGVYALIKRNVAHIRPILIGVLLLNVISILAKRLPE